MRATSTMLGGARPHGGLLQVKWKSPAWRAPTGQVEIARVAGSNSVRYRVASLNLPMIIPGSGLADP